MVLGEYHKNPSHHQIKAGFAAWFQQRTLIFEMLTETQAKRAAGVSHADMEALGTALAWQGSGWPSFEYFFPIFAAAPEAARFGLAEPLPKHEQIARQASLVVAHFDALLVEMLLGMVGIQRLRNGRLAQSALNCGPVAVITGNEHAGTAAGVLRSMFCAQTPLYRSTALARPRQKRRLRSVLMQLSAQARLSAMIPARRSNSMGCTIACHSVVISLRWGQQREGET